MKFTLFIVFTLISLILFSCKEDIPPREATYMPLNQLENEPGYSWLPGEINAYQPDISIINKIKAITDTTNYTFLVYVNPSCACSGTQKQFPATIKILQSCGISEPRYKIYSMISENDLHPFMTHLKLKILPTFMIMKDSNAIYSVIDSIPVFERRDPNPVVPYSIEKVFLMGLQK